VELLVHGVDVVVGPRHALDQPRQRLVAEEGRLVEAVVQLDQMIAEELGVLRLLPVENDGFVRHVRPPQKPATKNELSARSSAGTRLLKIQLKT
jgi:hypothetical protein